MSPVFYVGDCPMNRQKQNLNAIVLNEGRLRAMGDTGLVASCGRGLLDRLTQLAAGLVGAPATFLSLVDATRDVF